MPRPKRLRTIVNPPLMDGFKPYGIPNTRLERVVLLYEEYESIRLTDYEGLTQAQSAECMNVSRPTFTRIYEKARKTIAQAFVEGKTIVIDGGNIQPDDCWYRCIHCRKVTICKNETSQCGHCQSGSLRLLTQVPKIEINPAGLKLDGSSKSDIKK